MKTLAKLVRYKRWADALMLADVGSVPLAEAERSRATRWDNMIRTMNHVRVVDDIFRAHLTGTAHSYTYRNTDVTPALGELVVLMDRLDRWYIVYVDGLDDSGADEIVRFRFLDGSEGALTRQEIILHVVNHATYHRGLVSDMLYQAGSMPTTNDLPVFLAEAFNRNYRPVMNIPATAFT